MAATNLSPERTSIIGRGAELGEVRGALARGARLVTLFGPPGSGKSRLARQVGLSELASYEGGVWRCDLAAARADDDVVALVCQALGVDAGPEELAHAMRARGRTLFVMDDAERAAPALARLVGRWLDASPRASFLVSSRERLRIDGEQCIEVGPLGIHDALTLIAARVALARAGFSIRDVDRPLYEEIAARLDAIPLALELAAARLAVMSPRAMLELWASRAELLRSARRDAPARQSTLDSALDWSWELLSAAERSALAQCAVFTGGFALEEAMRVVALPEGDVVVDVLTSLVDKSLLRASAESPCEARDRVQLPEGWERSPQRADTEGSGEARFAMYETIRAYAGQRLQESGGAEEAARRHAATYGAIAERSLGMGELAAERENLLAAHARLLEDAPLVAARTILGLAPLLLQRGPLGLLVARVDATLAEVSDAPAELRGALLSARGRARRIAGETESALVDLLGACELLTPSGGAALVAALTALGVARQARGEPEAARDALERAVVVARGAGDLPGLAEAERRLARLAPDREDVLVARQALDASVEMHDNLGVLFAQAGPIEAARAACEKALATQRAAGNRRSEGVIMVRLASLLLHAGDVAAARAHAAAARTIHREVADRVFEATSEWVVGLADQDLGAFDAAAEALERARALGVAVRARLVQGYAERALGELAWEMGDEPAARAHIASAAELLALAGDRANAGLARAEVGALDAQRGRLEDAARTLTEARLLAASSARHLAAIDVWAGFSDLAHALARGAAGGAELERAAARAEGPSDSRDARVARRLLQRALLAARLPEDGAATAGSTPAGSTPVIASREPAPQITVAQLGMWFQVGNAEHVDLTRRRAMRQLLWALVERRLAAPGEAMSLDAMLAAAWPGERILHKAGTARIYTAIRALRDMGLRDALLTAGDGYMIAPRAHVTVLPE